ncbi:MAG: phosphoribosylamine--glycine ligase, partial [Candidatus Margulisbacteria bacterium]|nr:phosphoribosylamine--glycine ligase [Candidatus Margulisiibacteriota bacterium]
MLTKDGPKVLEYNCRFGDPETQVVIPRLKSDLLEILISTIECRISNIVLEWDPRPAVCIVLAAGGYPGSYEKGIPIEGLDKAREEDDVIVFHAGTDVKDDKIVTSGGRVLGVVGLGDDIKGAIDRAYTAVELIHFKDMHYRKDIGKRALK